MANRPKEKNHGIIHIDIAKRWTETDRKINSNSKYKVNEQPNKEEKSEMVTKCVHLKYNDCVCVDGT